MNIDNQVNQIVQQVITEITGKIQQQVMDVVTTHISDITAKIDYQALFKSALTNAMSARQFRFPDASIPAEAIDFANLSISGSNISGGIVTNFGSTGIDDQSTACQLSIFDDVTVVENNLLTKDLTVKGTATIEGDLNVTGTLPESSPLFQQIIKTAVNNVRTSLDQVVFQNYADMVLGQIKKDGLDLTKITLNGTAIVDGGNLSNSITFSNLQRVGILQDLQVSGESVLSQTLYTANKRVGINTVEPAQALSIWDQEIEIGFGKHGNNVAIIGTPRSHALIISSNAKNNLVLTTDGGVELNHMKLGTMHISTSDRPPSNDMPKGALVFNNNPSLGGPLGWISLGDAKWANFGYID
jgi:hypothetical protein